jgi:hypothetical protein
MPAPGAAGDTPAPPAPDDIWYELKFAILEGALDRVAEWARTHLPPDPRAGAAGGDTYPIHSLYFDTDALDVYHRSPGYRKSKYRVRRYGQEAVLFLERKTKSRGRVREQRTAIPEAELVRLEQAAPEPGDWDGEWFRHRLRERGLVPQCRIAFRRLARASEAEGGPVRLALDRDVRCALARGLDLGDLGEGHWRPIAGNTLELKFRGGLPRLFKDLVRELSLSPHPGSKYRQAVALCGIAGGAVGGG